jgi:hypothetical protein
MGNTYRRSVTETSTVLTEVGGKLGEKRVEEDGNVYILAFAGAGINDGAACLDSATYGVVGPAGAADNTGDALLANAYFWGIREGRGYVKAAATGAIGDALISAAAGVATINLGASAGQVYAVRMATASDTGCIADISC